VIFGWDLANPSNIPNLKLIGSAIAEKIKGDPKFLGTPLAHSHAHFFLRV